MFWHAGLSALCHRLRLRQDDNKPMASPRTALLGSVFAR